MNTIKTILSNKFNWFLLGLALLIGVLYVAPELLIWNKLHSLDKPYVAIQLTHHGDEAYGTISLFREIYDGHFPVGDLYFDRNAPSPLSTQISALLMAGFIYLFGGNINISYLFATFILAPVLFLLFYWLGRVITGDKIYALLFSLLGVLTPISRALPAAFKSVNLFLGNIANYFVPLVRTPLAKLPLGRTEDPLLTYLVFLPAIAALLIFWQKPNKKTAAFAGALIGLMFYVYFHYWVFLVIVAGLIGLYALLRIKKDFQFLKLNLVLFGVLAIVTIPYWINFFEFRSSPTAAEVAARIGVETSRAPFFIGGEPAVFHYIFYAILAVVIYFVFYRRNHKNTAILYWIFVAAMFIIWNVQVITGFVPSPDHWFRPISVFVMIILFHSAYELLKKVNYKIVAVCLIIGSVLLLSKKVVNALVFVNPPQQFIDGKSFESRTFNPNIVESWDWINKNLPHEPKIISPSFITSLYLKAQTSARPYFAGGFLTSASNALLETRFLTTYKLFKVKPEFLEKVLRVNYRDFCSEQCLSQTGRDPHEYLNTVETVTHLYVGYYVNDPNRFPRSETTYRFVTKEKADELIAAYPKVRADWEKIDANYVYYGPWEKQVSQIDLSKDPALDLAFKNQEVEIYKIRE